MFGAWENLLSEVSAGIAMCGSTQQWSQVSGERQAMEDAGSACQLKAGREGPRVQLTRERSH